ncbi:putative DNA-binding protein escarola [Phtheirospermum japonicum]|uniref:AT-hook motif nuclear-localized protein n=1 Tax=Phtheirospermum japonicum TaxID=374723 RepID=A0A830B9T5_9LAMI|nr:putative DNA-binding protein escarola [Phtheirospermum japonicum]
MEGTNNNNLGITVVGSDAPSGYHVAPRPTNENPPQVAVSLSPAAVTVTPAPLSLTHPPPEAAVKKKRGRPRKYAPDGTVAKALSPKPISSSAPPPVIDFSAAAAKRGKTRPVGPAAKLQPLRVECLSWYEHIAGDWVPCSVGANFTPHIITVNAGEDVTMKIISFSQQGPRAICILSANGVISSVTLRQADSSGGTLTYEGRFEILSLTGSFMPSETGGMRNRSGGMSVSLASPDGRVFGGGVAGLLVAASPVQIVIGSFLAGSQLEQKAKKHKPESVTIISAASIPIGDTAYHTSPSFRGDSWSSMPPDARNQPTDINVTLAG